MIIRDTVVISAGEASPGSLPDLLTSSSIILPMAGYITIEYDSAYSLSHAIPTTSRITLRVDNRVYPDTGITARLRRHWTVQESWDPCSVPGDFLSDPAMGYYYARDTTHPATEWQFRPMPGVLPSEEITLRCSTTVLGTAIPLGVGLTGPDSVGQTLVWRGIAETDFSWYCNLSYRFVQKVWFSVIFSPDTVVRFSPLDSNSVYPYYPAIRNDTVTAGVKKRFMDLEARIVYGDSVLRNYPIRVDRPSLVDSGGHSHNGARPLGRYRVRNTAGNGFDTLSTFTRNTDSTGVLKFRYLASQFGGVERVRARLVSDTTKFDTLSLITRVPGLQELGKGTHYILVGAPDDVDPCPNIATSQHYRNHFGTSALLNAIERIAAMYDSLNPGIILRINDLSLEKGGLFDVNNNWRTGHSEHRVGMNADIGVMGINQATQCTGLNLEHLRRIIRRYTTGPTLEHTGSAPHFHVRHLEE